MKKYQIISISSGSMSSAQTEEHHRQLIKLTNDSQVPWWQNKPTVPSTRYVLDTFAAEEVGVPDPFGKEKQRFKLWRVDGDKSICLDEGIIEQEKLLVNRSHEDRRQFWIKGQKLASFFIETPMDGDDTPQFVIASGFKKAMDSFRAAHQR